MNPSFPVTVREARAGIRRMKAHPVPLARPLVILSGYLEPGVAPRILKKRFANVTGNERILGVSFAWCRHFDQCREKVIAAVEETFAGSDRLWTTEVDVVGISMGGLVARYAAMSRGTDTPARKGRTARRNEGRPSSKRRLRIARLFTIATPHRGARRAEWPTRHPLHADMRAGSKFLRRLNAPENAPAYPIYPYVRLGDSTVGTENAAPRGREVWWVPGRALQPSHSGAMLDPRIFAEIARRLRGEEPLTAEPAIPPPPPARS